MMKLGMKSRSRRVVQDSSMAVEKSKINMGKSNKSDEDEDCSYFCWASLPPELLREVLLKVEESECNWPARKHVVACAGVCKSWREVMKDLVKTPEVSGKITFPISVKQVCGLQMFVVFVIVIRFRICVWCSSVRILCYLYFSFIIHCKQRLYKMASYIWHELIVVG